MNDRNRILAGGAAIWASALLLAACSDSSQSSRDTLQDIDIKTLEGRVAALETNAPDETATVMPSDKGYSFLHTDAGALAIAFSDIEPYADGSRVQLKVGNLTSATITELKANVRWGPSDGQGRFKETPKELVQHTFKGPFPPGQWHVETIALPALPPSQVGLIQISEGYVNSVTLGQLTG